MKKTLKNWLIVIVVLSCLLCVVCVPSSADQTKNPHVHIFVDGEGPVYYGDTVTLKASVVDVDVAYNIIWEACSEEDNWEVVGTGKVYRFVMDSQTAACSYRAIVVSD